MFEELQRDKTQFQHDSREIMHNMHELVYIERLYHAWRVEYCQDLIIYSIQMSNLLYT